MNYTVCIITCFAGKRNNNLKNLYFYLQKDFSSVKITNVANLYRSVRFWMSDQGLIESPERGYRYV